VSETAPIRTLIADDEALARRGLRLRLEAVDDIEIIGEACNGAQAVELIRSRAPELVLLDIQMPGYSGFEVLRQLGDEPRLPVVVFVTAYDQYAIKAFEASALDYLLKPVDDSRLHQALFRVRETLEQRQAMDNRDAVRDMLARLGGNADQTAASTHEMGGGNAASRPRRLLLKDGHTTLRVAQDEVDWIEAAGDYMCVHVNGDTHVVRQTMKQLENLADPGLLVRIHRSTMVNIDRVVSIRPRSNGEYYLALKDGQELKLSRNYRDKLPLFQC